MDGSDQTALMVTLSPTNIGLGTNKTTLSTKEPKAHIDGLTENTEYGFQVRCKTLSGWGTYSQPVYAQTLQSVSPGNRFSNIFVLILGNILIIDIFIVYDDSMQMRIVAGATVAVVFVLVLG